MARKGIQPQATFYIKSVWSTLLTTPFFLFFLHASTFQLLDKPWSQVSCVPSSPRFSPSIFIAHRVRQSHCSSIFHRVLITHALALSASQSFRKKKSPRICTSMISGGFELTKLNYTLIRHRGDSLYTAVVGTQIRGQ